MSTKPSAAAAPILGFILFAAAPLAVQAQLTYENINGTGLVYDATDNIYWTQEANLSGTTYDFADAQTWAANLDYAGIGAGNWQLPSPADFTYIFSQLPANGPDGTDRYGVQQSFGSGPNDYFSNVQTTYWTDADGTDFNFFYGYPGGFPDATTYSVWAVTTVPEPGIAALGLVGIALAGARRQSIQRSRK